jgi:hypothetical protein
VETEPEFHKHVYLWYDMIIFTQWGLYHIMDGFIKVDYVVVVR